MINIKVQFSVQVSGGPQVSLPKEMEVEAYNKIKVAIEPQADPLVVEVAQGTISFLLIKSSLYSSSEGELTYKVGNGNEIQLDQPQIFLGTGAVSLLGTDLKQMTFSNKYPDEDKNKAEIEILVGRDATPNP
ncbi:MAG: hypothetical protein QNJ47_10130 [Nostocaceae cyanobacterium]|nr:hypothetical protein [Nostocaceae cyanobacterium]